MLFLGVTQELYYSTFSNIVSIDYAKKLRDKPLIECSVFNGLPCSNTGIERELVKSEGYSSILTFNYEIKDLQLVDQKVAEECFNSFAESFLKPKESKVKTIVHINKEKNQITAIFFCLKL